MKHALRNGKLLDSSGFCASEHNFCLSVTTQEAYHTRCMASHLPSPSLEPSSPQLSPPPSIVAPPLSTPTTQPRPLIAPPTHDHAHPWPRPFREPLSLPSPPPPLPPYWLPRCHVTPGGGEALRGRGLRRARAARDQREKERRRSGTGGGCMCGCGAEWAARGRAGRRGRSWSRASGRSVRTGKRGDVGGGEWRRLRHVGPPAQQCRRRGRTACCGRSTRRGAGRGAMVAGEALSGAMSPARRSRGRGRPPAGRSRRAGAATHGRRAPLSRRGWALRVAAPPETVPGGVCVVLRGRLQHGGVAHGAVSRGGGDVGGEGGRAPHCIVQ